MKIRIDLDGVVIDSETTFRTYEENEYIKEDPHCAYELEQRII